MSDIVYTTRPARESDEAPMMAIGHEGIRPYVEALRGWDPALEARQFREHFLVPRITILRVDDADVGYYRLDEEDHGLYLAGLYIDAPVRRRGLGRAVLQDLIERAQRDVAGIPGIDQRSVADHLVCDAPARD